MLIKMHITDIRIMNLMQISVQLALNVEVETFIFAECKLMGLMSTLYDKKYYFIFAKKENAMVLFISNE